MSRSEAGRKGAAARWGYTYEEVTPGRSRSRATAARATTGRATTARATPTRQTAQGRAQPVRGSRSAASSQWERSNEEGNGRRPASHSSRSPLHSSRSLRTAADQPPADQPRNPEHMPTKVKVGAGMTKSTPTKSKEIKRPPRIR